MQLEKMKERFCGPNQKQLDLKLVIDDLTRENDALY